MQQFKAKTLEEAYKKATADLNCSIINLDIKIIQSNSKGFLGFFTKEAIIEVNLKDKTTNQTKPKPQPTEDVIIQEITMKINNLFSHTCYNLDKIIVSFHNEKTLYIEFKGEDVALLIGKDGYRYKALLYILFSWIHEKYNLMVRVEVAQFLATQEETIFNYLIPVIKAIKKKGFFTTKPLDGILVHIALKRLRDEFPDKYVAIKTNAQGNKYILINEYHK